MKVAEPADLYGQDLAQDPVVAAELNVAFDEMNFACEEPVVYRGLGDGFAVEAGVFDREFEEAPVYRCLSLSSECNLLEEELDSRFSGAQQSAAESQAEWLSGTNPPLLTRQRAQSHAGWKVR